MSDLTSKDAEQDKQIAVLENYFGSMRERVMSLEERMTRKDDYDRLEKSIDEPVFNRNVYIYTHDNFYKQN